MCSFIFITIAALFLFNLKVCKGDGFENFLYVKMSEYPTWLKMNNLDPSAPLPGPETLSFQNQIAKMDCSLFNHTVENFSQELVNITIFGELAHGFIDLYFITASGTIFSGDYIAKGALYTNDPFAGSGRWFISSPLMETHAQLKFIITSNSHLNVETFYGVSITLLGDAFVHFEGLWDEGSTADYGEYIRNAIISQFVADVINSNTNLHPVLSPVKTYLLKILNETSMAEIIGTTKLPQGDLKPWFT